ncbi:MAG: 4-hydroxythreonine-4-phosphate dehydrogenase [Candidatus Binatota bacterium]|nr:4-hydroxythreonine-4-phosphate dehydrogenase [Candidatus Binatota bacterium]
MGDPAGIGPEVALRACARRAIRRQVRPVFFGDPAVFADTARRLAIPLRDEVVEIGSLAAGQRRAGRPSREGAEAAYRSILEAVAAVQRGRAAAVVTAPVSKRAIQDAGHEFPGHTEVIARLAGDADVRMMMAGASLNVVLVTTHVALAAVPGSLDAPRIAATATIAAAALRRHFGVRRPRIAIAGLNPHAGEGGAFGDEDERIVAPAVASARRRGLAVSGPYPADTVFHRARAGEFDAVVALYHDQGLIPFKLLHFSDGVNVTLGLPFPRTSPDHGTAFDIAGRGRADDSSMAAAIALAGRMALTLRRRRS